MRYFPNFLKRVFLPSALLAFGLALSSCRSGDETRSAYSYTPGFASPYRVAAVEKSWMARHKYDHERRLLVPIHNGTKWGAVQEYKEDGSIAFRDWWVRDVKVEDLEANPSTQVLAAERPEPAFTTDENLLGPASPVVSPTVNPLPPFGSGEPATATSPPLPEIEPFAPALPSNPGGAPEIAPFDLSTTAPAGGNVAAPSPFAPLPGAMPSPALPGTAMPANPLPGAMPAPGGGQPMAPPAFPGPVPALPGGGDPLAPAPMAPPMPVQPGVPPAGPAVPVPANPFPPAAIPAPGAVPGGNPAAPFPVPGGAAPAVTVPPQGAAPAPIEANPFAPLPGAQPAAPLPAQPANPLGGGMAPMPVPAPNNANAIPPGPAVPAAPVGDDKVPPPDPFGPAP